jgi:hypothetical protein
MATAKRLWERLTSALGPSGDSSSDDDDDGHPLLPTVVLDVAADDDEESNRGAYSVRDTLLSPDHVMLLEDCAQDLLMETASFREVERRLNAALAPLAKALAREVHCVDMELIYDGEQKTFFVASDFDRRHAPFDVFFADHAVATEAPLAAAFAEFRMGDLPPLKTVALNGLLDGDRIADGNPVRPSTLTLLLKYALRYLDADQLIEPLQDVARWPRHFGTAALLFDCMRSHRDRREACAEVLVRHCNAYYRLPAGLARALLAHARLQKDPYDASNFKIALDFEGESEIAAVHPSAVLTACYF